MASIFCLVTSEQWEEAKITGLVPNSNEEMNGICVHVYKFDDLSSACSAQFKAADNPLALEIATNSELKSLTWLAPSAEQSWSTGRLMIDNLESDLVLNVYSFVKPNNAQDTRFVLQGEA